MIRLLSALLSLAVMSGLLAGQPNGARHGVQPETGGQSSVAAAPGVPAIDPAWTESSPVVLPPTVQPTAHGAAGPQSGSIAAIVPLIRPLGRARSPEAADRLAARSTVVRGYRATGPPAQSGLSPLLTQLLTQPARLA